MKLPYYMMYPTPFLFNDDKTEQRDYEYVKSMYPEMAKQILPYVEEECDRMEYEGSMIYDEYPDKLQLRLMCSRIYDKVMKQEEFDGVKAEEVLAEQQEARPARYPGKKKTGRVRDMVELLLYQELLRRRCNNRRCKRKNIW